MSYIGRNTSKQLLILEVLTSGNYNRRKYKGTAVSGAFPQDQEKYHCCVAHGLQKYRDILDGHQAGKNLPVKDAISLKNINMSLATPHLQPEWQPWCTGRQVSIKFLAYFLFWTRWEFKLFLRVSISIFPQATGTSCVMLRAQGMKFFIKKRCFSL